MKLPFSHLPSTLNIRGDQYGRGSIPRQYYEPHSGLETCLDGAFCEDIYRAADAVTPHVLNGLLHGETEEQLPAEEEARPDYAIETFQGTDMLKAWEEFNSHYLEKGWGDGFPLVSPTDEKVDEMLKGTRRDPDEVVTILEPRYGIATASCSPISALLSLQPCLAQGVN